MLKNNILIVFLCFIVVKSFSQENNATEETNTIPKSIYSHMSTPNSYNNIVNLNERLKLNSYKFVFIDEKSVENGYFTISVNNPFKTSKYSLDTYKKIQNKLDLEKSFFKISKIYEPFQYLNHLQKKRFR